jgi:hypothetical protein
MLYAEHIKDVLLRKSALIVEPHQEWNSTPPKY